MNARAKILFLQPGVGSYRVDFFNALAEKFDLTVACYLDADHCGNDLLPRPAAAERLKNCRVIQLRTRLRAGRYPILRDLKKLVRDFSPNLVVAHEFSPVTLQLFLAVRRSPRIRFAVWSCDAPWMAAKCRPLRRLARRFFCRRADAVMLYSRATAEVYERDGVNPAKIIICPNVQSLYRLRAEAAAALPRTAALRDELKLRKNEVLFVFVGRFHKVKNLPGLLAAFKSAPANARLLLVGDGAEAPCLKQLAAGDGLAGRTVFAGRREGEELMAVYNAADVLILPSFNETFGAVVNEALALGVRVIASERAGAAALVNSAAQGQVVPPTVTALARAISQECRQSPRATPKPPLTSYDLAENIRPFMEYCSSLEAAP